MLQSTTHATKLEILTGYEKEVKIDACRPLERHPRLRADRWRQERPAAMEKQKERGNAMLQKEMNDENKEIKSKEYELYDKKHGFKDGNDYFKKAVRRGGSRSSGMAGQNRQSMK